MTGKWLGEVQTHILLFLDLKKEPWPPSLIAQYLPPWVSGKNKDKSVSGACLALLKKDMLIVEYRKRKRPYYSLSDFGRSVVEKIQKKMKEEGVSSPFKELELNLSFEQALTDFILKQLDSLSLKKVGLKHEEGTSNKVT